MTLIFNELRKLNFVCYPEAKEQSFAK